MRDQDFPVREGQPLGRLIQSGIRPERSVDPAAYALPPGVAALQDEPARESPFDVIGALSDHRLRRRQFLSFLVGGITIGSGALFLGGSFDAGAPLTGPRHRRYGTRLTQDDLRVISSAQLWADAPIDQLVGTAPAFLWTFKVVEPDATLERGLDRLCEFSKQHGREEAGYETAVRILRTFETVPAPSLLSRHRSELQDVVWRWHTRAQSRGH